MLFPGLIYEVGWMDVWIKYEGPYLKSGPQETMWDWSVMVDEVTASQESRLALLGDP